MPWSRLVPHRPARLLGLSAFALALIWLGWQVLLNAAPGDRPVPDPDRATAWAASHAPELVRLAERHLAGSDPESINWEPVERAARQALRRNPLEGRALALLALAAHGHGDDGEAQRLMEIAGKRSLRDARVHLWLADRRLQEGAYREALFHMDVVLRMRGRERDRLRPALVAMAQNEETLPHLVDVLGDNPRWRGWLLDTLTHQDNPSVAAPVLAALEASAHPPTLREVRRYLERLIAAERYGEAYLAWRRFLPEDRQADTRYLHNGDFARTVTNLPFDWVIESLRGAEIAVVGADDRRRLRIQFGRNRVDFRNVSKLMVLPPGSYRFSGAAEAREFGNPRGLQWTLRCAGGEELAATERLTGTMERHAFEIAFTVPATGCRAQWLRLELAARAARERDVDGGTVWYDALELVRSDLPG